jgi:hypothetical protein
VQECSTQNTDLLETLSDLFLNYGCAYSQERVFQRSCSLAMSTVFSFSRKTMTQLLTALGEVNKDWTASYRHLSCNRFDADKVAQVTFQQTLAHVEVGVPYTMVIDGTHIARSSMKMPGTSWSRGLNTAKWNRGLQRCQRFSNICWLTPIQEGYCRAIPLKWEHIPSEKAIPSCDPPRKEWEAAGDAMRWARERLEAAGRTEQPLLVFADGSYDVNKLWASVPTRTTLVARCAKNRKLRRLPQEPQAGQRGARRKYGETVPAPEQMRHEQAAWQKVGISVRGKELQIKCRVTGPFLVEGAPDTPLMLLLVKGYHRKHVGQKNRPPCQYLVNAVKIGDEWQLPFPLSQIIEGTWHRWEVEVCHREIKTSFGLGQMQCWSSKGSPNSVRFMAWAYSVLLLAGFKTSKGLFNSAWVTPGCWSRGRRRWSLSTLMQAYRKDLWDFGQIRPVYPTIPHKRHKILNAKISLENAAIGGARG